MGNLGLSCMVECVEQAPQSELASASSSEGTRIELLEHGRLKMVVDGLGGHSVLISAGSMQVIDCPVWVPGKDMASKGRQTFGEGPFMDARWCKSWSTNGVEEELAGKGGGG